jgi:hypothetical protein
MNNQKYPEYTTPTIVSERDSRKKDGLANTVLLRGYTVPRKNVEGVLNFHRLAMGANRDMIRAVTILDREFYS